MFRRVSQSAPCRQDPVLRGLGASPLDSGMPVSTEGVLVTCDVPMRQFILHLDELAQQEAAGEGAFVIKSDLDSRHLLVKEWAVELIQQRVEELMASNHFSRDAEPFAETLKRREVDGLRSSVPAGRKRR